jgi:hypothetical protein
VPGAAGGRASLRAALLTVAIALILCVPCLRLGYFWDDYVLLTRTQADPLAFLVPRSGAVFYRPLSQGLYFLVLSALGTYGPVLGHVMNFCLLGGSIVLLMSLASRLAGPRAGLLAGLAFATYGCVPSLVAWTSCAQDLLAIFFLLVALRFRDSGSNALAFIAATCAILSKETAVVVLPALVLWDVILGRGHKGVRGQALLYGGLAIVWASLHPGIRSLVGAGGHQVGSSYIGIENSTRWVSRLSRYALALLNVPITGFGTSWPAGLTWAAAVGLIALWAASRTDPSGDQGPRPEGLPMPRIAALAATLAAPPLLVAAFLVRPWVAYLTAVPAIGSALLIGTLLSRASRRTAAIALCVFLVLGVWSRGVSVPNEIVWTERSFVDAAGAIRQVEQNFMKVRPSLPRGAQVLLSPAGTSTLGIYSTLLEGQALRLWYADPKLVTLLPEQRRASASPEFLFRVTASLDVAEIEPGTSYFRSTGERLDREEVAGPLRSYARGLAASGETGLCLRILSGLSRVDQGRVRSYDIRLAAMALRHSGRVAEAEQVRARADPLTRGEARDMVAKLLAEPTGRAELDSNAYWAFGVSPDDPQALRYMIEQLGSGGYSGPSLELRRRLRRLAPKDAKAPTPP